MLNGENMQPRIFYPARLSFRVEEKQSFQDKQTLNLVTTTSPTRNTKGDLLKGKERTKATD